MKKRFIEGQLILQRNVDEGFVSRLQEDKADIFAELENWARSYEISYEFGITGYSDYVCEYRVVARSASMCKSILSELKEIVKPITNKKVELGYKISGTCRTIRKGCDNE